MFVASEPFMDAADTQADALGVDVRRVFVAHPIQDRTDDEMTGLADEVVAELVAALARDSSG